MKIKEIITPDFDEGTYYSAYRGLWCRAGVARTLNKYEDEDSVIVHHSNTFGGIFILKTSRSFMAFIYLNRDLIPTDINYHIFRIDVKEAINVLNKIKDYQIYNEDLFQKAKNTALVEGLKS